MRIRRVAPADIPALARIAAAAYRDAFAAIIGPRALSLPLRFFAHGIPCTAIGGW